MHTHMHLSRPTSIASSLALLAMLLAGCTSNSSNAANTAASATASSLAPAATTAATVFSGELTYRARIAVPEDTIAIIELRAGPEEHANVLAEQRIPLRGAQVPVPFALATGRLQGGVDYRLRGALLVKGKPAWVSDAVAVGAQSQDLGPLFMQPVRAEPFASTLRCGAQEIVISPAEGGLNLRTGNVTQFLKAAPAASGSKYVAADDASTFFWSKGKTGTLQLKGKTYPECVDAKDSQPVFTARGNEPGWRVQAFDRRCKDSMTGMPYPQSVELTMNKKTLKGCGGNPADLLTGDEWKIESINGEAVIDNSRASLQFDSNGRVAGNSSCNRYTGGYTLTGENLRFGQLAGTMMACTPELMAQEQLFFKVMSAVQGFDIRDDGALVLQAGKQNIVARRH